MGTRGHAGAFLGSNTQRVVRHAKTPVIAVHEAPGNVENIVFPVGSDVLDEGLVMQVKRLQELFKSTFHLVHINTPMLLRPDYIVLKSWNRLRHDLTSIITNCLFARILT